jgi:hypothetical protein
VLKWSSFHIHQECYSVYFVNSCSPTCRSFLTFILLVVSALNMCINISHLIVCWPISPSSSMNFYLIRFELPLLGTHKFLNLPDALNVFLFTPKSTASNGIIVPGIQSKQTLVEADIDPCLDFHPCSLSSSFSADDFHQCRRAGSCFDHSTSVCL